MYFIMGKKRKTEETIQKIKDKSKGRLPLNNKEITIDEFFYISMAEASRQLNIPVPTILWRLKSKKSEI
jgi:hypothetical protein